MRSENFEDLQIWQVGMTLLVEAYSLTSDLPSTEKFGLVTQLNRAAVSVPANIAEGWGRGRGASQANFVRIARGSIYEVQTLLEVIRRLELGSDERAADLKVRYSELGKMVNGYLTWLESTYVRDETAEYAAVDVELTTNY